MNRSTTLAALLTATIVAVVQQTLLLLAPMTVAIAGVVAGVVIGVLQRPDDVRDVLAPAVVVGLVGTLTSGLLMAVTGTHVLEPRYLLSWIIVAVVGIATTAGIARITGTLSPRSHA